MARLISTDTDTAVLAQGQIVGRVEELDVGGPFRAPALQIIVGVIGQERPGQAIVYETGIDGVVIQRTPDIDSFFRGKKVIGVSDQGEGRGVFVAFFFRKTRK